MDNSIAREKKTAGKLIGTILVTGAITVAITIALTLMSAASGGFASDGSASNGAGGSRQWTWPIAIHLATVLPAFAIGGFMIARPKGTPLHRLLGRLYCVLMLTTATATLFIRAPGAGLFGTGYSPLHLFTVVAFTTVPYAIWTIRRGNVQAHREAMKGSYIGLCIAGAFAFIPGRLLSTALFG
ncbi:DUF2306 domain-containing protein [Erythrobacteraceae bacterium WH01K]|nr:DUF2306 domain-containing protein [Erythrobacteraceae bacterium WH01K]